jgi:4-hydroxy 2-oxovalerate aldolase
MKKITVLDCTLRDGGYCNNWEFGNGNIKRIVHGLIESGVDYVECGFLTDRVVYNAQKTKYTNFEQLKSIVPKEKNGKKCLVMVNYGEYAAKDIPHRSETCVDGIRVAFHKKDYINAIKLCQEIKNKGFYVFVQPMVSMNYSDDEFVSLIDAVNQIDPTSFYVVDSFGTMKRKDLMHYITLADKHLCPDICLGFHAHNNLQLAYSNAQYLVETDLNRSLIIDVSVHGMGRGAGNLNSELFLEYLNDRLCCKYNIKSILSLLDESISRFYEEKPWGYSLPNYLSAIHMIHPNYATYLSSKKTLTYEAMDDIFGMVDSKKGFEYDETYIESLYVRYLSNGCESISLNSELHDTVKDKKILLIAPGRNALLQKDRIIAFAKNHSPIIVSINHDYPYLNCDYDFVSNMRRFRQLPKEVYGKTIVTSNIDFSGTFSRVDYNSLLNPIDGVRDNAGLMAIKLFANLECSDIYIAGFDGYRNDDDSNFETKEMVVANSSEMVKKINRGMIEALNMFAKKYHIEFVTDSILNGGIVEI